jgi:hypothetical protein
VFKFKFSDVGIKSGENLYLVLKEAIISEDKKEEQTAGQTAEQTQQQPVQDQQMPDFAAMFGGGNSGFSMPEGMGIPSMGGAPAGGDPSGAGGAMGGFNPEMMSNIMNNPMVKSMISDLFSDPEKIKGIIDANPMLKQMAEGNPEIEEMIKNPEKIQDQMKGGQIL